MKKAVFIPRKLSKTISRLKSSFPCLTITGPRQSGKTTLCRKAFPKFPYYNMEDEATRELVLRDTRAFVKNASAGGGVIIDEAQRVPEIFSYVQVVSDENPKRKFILSGSNNFLLMEKITQSLAGRAAVLKLLPFSLEELGGKRTKISANELIFRGGFPRIWNNVGNATVADIFAAYYETYIERDVRQIEEIRNLAEFQKFIRLCAGSIGQEFNANAFSNALGVSVPTVQKWLSVLEASYIIFRLPPYFKNFKKRIIKAQKFYFYDTGLACWLLGISSAEQLDMHFSRGALFENLVVLEFFKRKFSQGKTARNFFFYRDNLQKEIDLIEDDAGNLSAYEIKSSGGVHDDFFKSLDYFKKLCGDDVVSTKIIYDGELEMNKPNHGIINFRHL